LRDNIHGVTKGDIRYVSNDASKLFGSSLLAASKLMPISLSRRLARRGGVKRISATIYDDVRAALKQRLEIVSFERRDNMCRQFALTKL
jgi:hypothetical protein